MKLTLIRTYHPTGTNGTLYCNGEKICHTIELPWLDNRPQCSCIPEGSYVLKQRWSVRFGLHLQVTAVPGRSFILFHPANDAVKELKGCIAPVTSFTGEGSGSKSRIAFRILMQLVSKQPRQEPIILEIHPDIIAIKMNGRFL